MDKEIATAIVNEVLKHEASISNIFEMCKKIIEPDLREKLVHNSGMLIGHAQDLILCIERVYPDLNPDL
ncbi:MAG: hypothetical protein RL748_130 [Pseudomonadota bacterium]